MNLFLQHWKFTLKNFLISKAVFESRPFPSRFVLMEFYSHDETRFNNSRTFNDYHDPYEDEYWIMAEASRSRSKRSVPLRDQEMNITENPAVTISTFGALIYLGFTFAFIIYIFLHQWTVKMTGTTDICAAPSFLNSLFVWIELCPELPDTERNDLVSGFYRMNRGWFAPLPHIPTEDIETTFEDLLASFRNFSSFW